MANILTQKAGSFSIMDAVFVALGKSVTDAVVNPLVGGGGTLMSGAIKAGGALALGKLIGGQVGGILATSLMVSGADDIVSRFIPSSKSAGAVGGRQAEGQTPDNFGQANQNAGIMQFI